MIPYTLWGYIKRPRATIKTLIENRRRTPLCCGSVRAALSAGDGAPPSPFAIPDFRFYWTARLASTIAQMCMVIVIGWQVYDIARLTMDTKAAALQLGIIGLVQFVPLFALTLVTGWVADRLDRRYIARGAIALEMVCAAILAWFAWHGTTTLPILFAVAALLGVARAFAGPALSALAPNLVPREILPKAIAMSSIAWQSGAIAGPALGGYLYAWAPVMPYAVSAGLFTLSLLCMVLIGPIARSAIGGSRNPWRQMVDGLHYVRQNRLVLGAISLDLFAVLLGGATAMLPVFARDILHAGPTGLGHLRAAPALGATLTALVVLVPAAEAQCRGQDARRGRGVRRRDRRSSACRAGCRLSLLCLAVLGDRPTCSRSMSASRLIQLYTPDDMRGRVGAVSSLFISASNELGEAESRLPRGLARPGRGGGRGRVRRDRGDLDVGEMVSRASPCAQLPRTQHGRRVQGQGDGDMRAGSILETVGSTPHIRVNRLFGPDAEVWIKSERSNPGGSIKDRIALSMVEDAERSGALKPGGTIIEPTSGNTGVGLAMVAAVKGYKLILVMPESMSLERRRLMLAYGATFDLTPKEGGMKARDRARRGTGRGRSTARGCRSSSRIRPISRSMSAPPRPRSSPISPTARSTC